jgi:NADPH:quinone reductase-like Zn-dependent oxidoreductase
VAEGLGKLTIKYNIPIPPLANDIVIVKTATVAINPTDAKMLDYSLAVRVIHGYDFASIVVALRADALIVGRLLVSDRVAGLVYSINKLKPDIGAFAEYIGAYRDLLLKILDHISFEEAATLGTGTTTATLGLFHELRIPASLE